MNAVGNQIPTRVFSIDVYVGQHLHQDRIGGQGEGRSDLIIAGAHHAEVRRSGAAGGRGHKSKGTVRRKSNRVRRSRQRNGSLQRLQGRIGIERTSAVPYDKSFQSIGRKCSRTGGRNAEGGDGAAIDGVHLVRSVLCV